MAPRTRARRRAAAALATVLASCTSGEAPPAARRVSAQPAEAQRASARPPAADAERSAQVDALFEPWARPAGPGVAVLVTRDGQVLHMKGYGLADVEARAPITPRTLFELASLSKQFTGMAVMQLAARGALSYDDSIHRHLPGFAGPAAGVTVRDLLGHTSGLPDYVALFRARGPAYDAFPRAERGAAGVHEPSVAEMLDTLARQPLRFAPRTEYEYSNSGYLVAAAIVERAAGTPFPRYLREHVFEPAGMPSTAVNGDSLPHTLPLARSYTGADGRWERLDYTPLDRLYGAAGIVSNLQDLARWYAAVDAASLVTRQVQDDAFATGVLAGGRPTEYGFGWVVASHTAMPRLAHGGWTKGFRNIVLRFPAERLTVVLLSNDAGFAPLRNEMAFRTARIWLRDLRPISTPAPRPPDLAALEGTYTTASGQAFHVRRSGGVLLVRTPENTDLRLHASRDGDFFVEGVEEQRFGFSVDAEGRRRITRMEFGLGSTVRTLTTAARR